MQPSGYSTPLFNQFVNHLVFMLGSTAPQGHQMRHCWYSSYYSHCASACIYNIKTLGGYNIIYFVIVYVVVQYLLKGTMRLSICSVNFFFLITK